MNLLDKIRDARVIRVYPFSGYSCKEKSTVCYARAIVLETESGEQIILTANPYDETITVQMKNI